MINHGVQNGHRRSEPAGVTMGIAVASTVFLLAAAAAPHAEAQTDLPLQLSMVAGAVEFDLSGTGVTPGVAIRGTRVLSPRVDLEVGSLFASPGQQFGSSTLLIPEAQLKHHWRLGRVSPFVGGGGGAAFVSRSSGWDARPTLSLSTGALVRLDSRWSIAGELRARGIGRSFSASTAEWLGGVTYGFGH